MKKEESRTINSVRNIFTGVCGQGINLCINIINRVVFLRVLNSEYLGVSSLFTDLLTLLSLAELGVGNAINYSLYKPLNDKDYNSISGYMNAYKKLYTTIGCVIGAIGLLLVPFIRQIISDAPNITENIEFIYVLFLANTAFSYFFSYKTALLIADQKTYIVNTIQYTANIGRLIIQIIALYVTKSYLTYLIIQVVFTVVSNLLIAGYVDHKYKYLDKKVRLDKNRTKSLFVNTKAMMLLKTSGVLINNTDNFIINRLVNLSTIGFLSNYNVFVTTANSLLNQVFNGVTASVGNLTVNSSARDQEKVFWALNMMNFWLYSWFAIGFWILASDIVGFLYGSEYVMPTYIIAILGLNCYIAGMQNALWTFRNTTGLFVKGQYILFITAAANIMLSILLGIKYQTFGILVATALARLLTNVWYEPLLIFRYGFGKSPKKYYGKYILYAMLLILTSICCFFLTRATGNYFWLNIIIVIFVPNIIYLLAFHKTQEFNFIFSHIKGILRK